MRTYEEIEARREEMEHLRANGMIVEEAFNTEWAELYDEEMAKQKEDFSVAIAENENVIIFVRHFYEMGWQINYKANGEWKSEEIYLIIDAMKRFADLAREYKVKTCLIEDGYLDMNTLKEIDEQRIKYDRQEAYADACMASWYGDNSLMDKWNRDNDIETEYGPSNPWDAPDMKVSDFI